MVEVEEAAEEEKAYDRVVHVEGVVLRHILYNRVAEGVVRRIYSLHISLNIFCTCRLLQMPDCDSNLENSSESTSLG